jgi:hypothetical protein
MQKGPEVFALGFRSRPADASPAMSSEGAGSSADRRGVLFELSETPQFGAFLSTSNSKSSPHPNLISDPHL